MPRQPMMPTFIGFKFTATRPDSQQMVPHFSPWKGCQDTETATWFLRNPRRRTDVF